MSRTHLHPVNNQWNYHCLHVQLHLLKLIANSSLCQDPLFCSFMMIMSKKDSFSANEQSQVELGDSSQCFHRNWPDPNTVPFTATRY